MQEHPGCSLRRFIELHSSEMNWHVKCTRRVCVQLWPILVRRFCSVVPNSNGLNGPAMSCGATHECLSMERTMRTFFAGRTSRQHSHSTVEWESIVLWEANTHSALVSPQTMQHLSAHAQRMLRWSIERNPFPIIHTFIVYLYCFFSKGSKDLANMPRTCPCLLLAISPIDRSSRS